MWPPRCLPLPRFADRQIEGSERGPHGREPRPEDLLRLRRPPGPRPRAESLVSTRAPPAVGLGLTPTGANRRHPSQPAPPSANRRHPAPTGANRRQPAPPGANRRSERLRHEVAVRVGLVVAKRLRDDEPELLVQGPCRGEDTCRSRSRGSGAGILFARLPQRCHQHRRGHSPAPVCRQPSAST